MSSRDFYSRLPALNQFLELANPNSYVDAPDDWYVLVTDIVNSTQAIVNGHYKEVNLLGASSIMSVLNAGSLTEFPFVFGGDGAYLLVPAWALQAAREALLGLRSLARQAFDLDLRVGIVPVSTITQQVPLKVAKFRLTPYCSQANFIGGGLTYAGKLVKEDARYRLDMDSDLSVDLSGLECRWQEIPSLHGHILSLIVAVPPSSRQTSEQTYCQVLKTIRAIYGDMRRYRPINPAALRLSFNPRRLMTEVKARASSLRWRDRLSYLVRITLENCLGFLFMVLHQSFGNVQWGRYKDDLCNASDYQKIDDLLHMVISGTPKQTEQLTAFLEQQMQAGNLVYGLHISDRALMTCLILGRRDHHIHLIDGADGGYALAALALKERLSRKAQNWSSYVKLAKRRQRNDFEPNQFL